MTPDDQIAAYFEARARQRQQDIDARLAQLTPRERSLVRDAAVMGYVLGSRHPRDEDIPLDDAVMRSVVYAAIRDNEYFHVLRGAAHEYTEPGAS